MKERRTLFLDENKQIKKKKNKHYISENEVELIKVFGIKDEFNFDYLKPYLEVVDFFLFDTKGKERGGNGTKFDWSILKKYPFRKPFFLSGGIGIEDIEAVQEIIKSNLPICDNWRSINFKRVINANRNSTKVFPIFHPSCIRN